MTTRNDVLATAGAGHLSGSAVRVAGRTMTWGDEDDTRLPDIAKPASTASGCGPTA